MKAECSSIWRHVTVCFVRCKTDKWQITLPECQWCML